MRSGFITFRSVTFAQRGESVLRQAGFFCTLQRTPRWMEEQGCGYCLRIKPELLPAAVEALQRKQVPFRRAFAQNEDGSREAVQL